MADRDEQSYRGRWGLAATLQSACLSRLRRWFGLRIYGIFLQPLESPPEPDPGVPGFSARIFESGEADVLLAHVKSAELDLTDAFVRQALGKGDACLAILHADAIVAYTWCAFSPTHDEDGVFVGFRETDRYVYKMFTLPDYRGLHLLRVFTPVRNRYSVTVRGATRSISYIGLDNHSSMRHSRAVGTHRIGTAGYLKWGPIFWPFATRRVREHGFHFFRRTQW